MSKVSLRYVFLKRLRPLVTDAFITRKKQSGQFKDSHIIAIMRDQTCQVSKKDSILRSHNFLLNLFPIHFLFTSGSLPIHFRLISSSLLAHFLFTSGSLPVHFRLISSSLPAHFLFTTYSFLVTSGLLLNRPYLYHRSR